MDVPVFEEAAEANLMLPYTGGKPHKRHAILAINMKGGGGFEIWQYTSRTPQPANFEIQLGDLGINIAKIKSTDVRGSFEFLQSRKADLLSSLVSYGDGANNAFYLKDPWGNLFQVMEGKDWFPGKGYQLTGGAGGCIIGVADMERSKQFYAKILGYDKVIYEGEGSYEDFAGLPGGNGKFKRVILTHSKERVGAFSKLLGSSEIELLQVLDRTPGKIYENRFWGDLGFIHLCFDIGSQKEMKQLCESAGHPYTVDSGNIFDMGEAAGHFSYIEDPDGTLIEFVETKKIPILKKIGWYLDLTKRDPAKPLPNWMLKALGLTRVKDK